MKLEHFCDVCRNAFDIRAYQEPGWGEAYEPWRCEKCLWPVYREHPTNTSDAELFLLFIAGVEPTTLLYPSASGFLEARTMTERGVRQIAGLAGALDFHRWRARVTENKNRASKQRVETLVKAIGVLMKLSQDGKLSQLVTEAESAAIKAKRAHIFPYLIAWTHFPALATPVRLVLLDVLRQPEHRMRNYADLWQGPSPTLCCTALDSNRIVQSVEQLVSASILKFIAPTLVGPQRGLMLAFEVDTDSLWPARMP